MKIGNLKFFEKRVIGDTPGEPLLIRWILFRSPAFGIFVHKLCRSDHDKALHCHPWDFTSVILRGGYSEVTQLGTLTHRPGDVVRRIAEWQHRVVIDGKPSWNLLFVGRKRRKWGFYPKGEFCYWRKYNYRLGICSEEVLHYGDE